MDLTDLKIGEKGKINGFSIDIKIRERLKALGINEGTTVSFVRVSPFGDPMVIKVYDGELIIRKSIAGGILIRKE